LSNETRKSTKILKKLILAVAFALLLALLGIFDGIGYHVYQISEISFVRQGQFGYAIATFKCDILYNPIIYPFYWNIGEGQIKGSFFMFYVPDAYAGSRPYYPPTPQERLPAYVMSVTSRGILPNLIILFILTGAIEAIGKRSLYLVVFGGVIGFYFSQIIGVIAGVVAGSVAAACFLKYWKGSKVEGFWKTIWQQ
jgi:hypothetical protein